MIDSKIETKNKTALRGQEKTYRKIGRRRRPHKISTPGASPCPGRGVWQHPIQHKTHVKASLNNKSEAPPVVFRGFPTCAGTCS